ncbi:ABC transporter ATP-binding protein [Roseinatronobacter alkalisoli]|uniref:ABC transporter ATP-binding protein n=1 Tax=Roseinatronobacter alkalisoli TaxID=3028235 RepID=A0ABT5TBV2_9RHOB|nr:ABC transporter ATP-binding protein [Roseinatronobacter sp. HJB301]MDD7972597.1 ABC transporter ATP-binding protein [Roseinatronobacter sp. HJB301]
MLAVQDLYLSFGGIKALQGVSFAAQPGQITAIIGPNGAGKTSLFNAISGFYRPDNGKVIFDGQDITALRPDKRAELGIARTFQNIALFRGMSVLDNIKLGAHTRLKAGVFDALRYFGRAQAEELELRADIEQRVIEFLEIDHIRKAPVSALPYGLQKRVELGRALAMRPRLLMLDEPVAGMNREETEDMARFILDVQEEFGTTILLVEHDMHLVMDICTHVVVLNFGAQIASGPPETVRMDAAVIEAYLGAAA